MKTSMKSDDGTDYVISPGPIDYISAGPEVKKKSPGRIAPFSSGQGLKCRETPKNATPLISLEILRFYWLEQ